MKTAKYAMDHEGRFAIVSRMTGVQHTNLAFECLGGAMRQHLKSAGFLWLEDDGSLKSYGRSETLDLDSRAEDGEIITAGILDGRARLQSIYGREEDFYVGDHEELHDPNNEVATLDNLLTNRVLAG